MQHKLENGKRILQRLESCYHILVRLDLSSFSVSLLALLKHVFSNTFHLSLLLELRDLRGEKKPKKLMKRGDTVIGTN